MPLRKSGPSGPPAMPITPSADQEYLRPRDEASNVVPFKRPVITSQPTETFDIRGLTRQAPIGRRSVLGDEPALIRDDRGRERHRLRPTSDALDAGVLDVAIRRHLYPGHLPKVRRHATGPDQAIALPDFDGFACSHDRSPAVLGFGSGR